MEPVKPDARLRAFAFKFLSCLPLICIFSNRSYYSQRFFLNTPLSLGSTGERTRAWAALGSTFLLVARRLGPGSGLAPNLLSFKRISVAASVKLR